MIGRSDGKFPGLSGFRALPLQVEGEEKGPTLEVDRQQIASFLGAFFGEKSTLKKGPKNEGN